MASPFNPLRMHKPGGRDVSAASGPRHNAAMDNGMGKESSEQAGYMELEGAVKDADCSKVQVDGGVSSDLGCCNEFDPQPSTQKFSCGTCTFETKTGGTPGGEESAPLAGGNSQPVVTGQPS